MIEDPNAFAKPAEDKPAKPEKPTSGGRLFYFQVSHYHDLEGRHILERAPCGRTPKDWPQFAAVVPATVQIFDNTPPMEVELPIGLPARSATEAFQVHDEVVTAKYAAAVHEYIKAKRAEFEAEMQAQQSQLVVPR